MMEALKPYLLFCMGPTRQEQALLLRTVPAETRVALTQPGLLHCLPDSVQAMLLPAVTPMYDTVTAVNTSSNSSSSSNNRSNALCITQCASPERSLVSNNCDVDYAAHSASVDSDDDTVVHGSGTGYASSCSSDDAAVQNSYDDVSDNVSTAANSPATVRYTARQQQQQQQHVTHSNNSGNNSSRSTSGNTAVRSSNTGTNASVETHQSDSPANVEVDGTEPAVETSEPVTLEDVARTMVQNRVKGLADSVVQGVLACINGRVLSGTAVLTGTALAVQLCSSQRARYVTRYNMDTYVYMHVLSSDDLLGHECTVHVFKVKRPRSAYSSSLRTELYCW
jgi:hypothetical protein